MYKGNDFEFQGHTKKINNFNSSVGFFDLENIPTNNFTEKFGREDQNTWGLQHPHPWLSTMVKIDGL